MSKDNNNLSKIVIISIAVIINIICIIAVISTVGSAIKNLRANLESGNVASNQEVTEGEYASDGNNLNMESTAEESEEINATDMFKLVMQDNAVRKSLILMVMGLILLGVAIYIFIKIR